MLQYPFAHLPGSLLLERSYGHSHADCPQGGVSGPLQRYLLLLLYWCIINSILGMASPLLGIAGVNSLLFAAYGASKRIISPFPQLSLKEIAAAGAMAGAANAILASPGTVLLIESLLFLNLCPPS